MTQLSLLEAISSVPAVVVGMGLEAADVTRRREPPPADDFDAFLQAQQQRVRDMAYNSWRRVYLTRGKERKALNQAPNVVSRLACDVQSVTVKGTVSGLSGPKLGPQE